MYLKNHGIPSADVQRAFEIVLCSSDGFLIVSLTNFSMKLPLKLRMHILEISTVLTSATLAKIQKGCPSSSNILINRLDVMYQVRGDFKETFNMGKFMDPTYQQNLPPILAPHWPEIQQFQKHCHAVTMKVLTLFALALNVIFLSALVDN